jgi:GT2 family glycosyltransferase
VVYAEGEGRPQLRITAIVPFHSNAGHLEQCLVAIRRSMPEAGIIVVADGAVEDCRVIAHTCQARVLEIGGPRGPAVARNRGASRADADLLVFVDADVVVAPDAIQGMCDLLDTSPDVSAVFGAYDLAPSERNFMSQFKNLSHAYVHETGRPDAQTFWAGLGAIRAPVFRMVGGFDERFRRPSIEDIDLGYRIVAAGGHIRLDPRFRGTHLKRWTLRSCIVTDLRARGIPWTQLLLRRESVPDDLNTRHELRLSVVAACAALASLLMLAVTPWGAAGVVLAAGTLVALNLDYYRWFTRHRGPVFAARVVAVHLIHHLCNALSILIGTTLHLAGRAGLRLPGALPSSAWKPDTSVDAHAGARG